MTLRRRRIQQRRNDQPSTSVERVHQGLGSRSRRELSEGLSFRRRPCGPAQVHRRSVRLGQQERTARPDPVPSRPPWGDADSVAQHHEPPRPTDSAPQSRLLGRKLDSRHPCPTNPQVQFRDTVAKRRTTPRPCLHFTRSCTPQTCESRFIRFAPHRVNNETFSLRCMAGAIGQ
jgi:hypothetical protein